MSEITSKYGIDAFWMRAAGMDQSLREYANTIAGLKAQSELEQASIRFLKSRGCRFMSYHYLPPVGSSESEYDPGQLIYAYGFPQSWVTRYIDDRLFKTDPIPRISQASTKPFKWLDLVGASGLSSKESEFMDILASEGLGNGLAIPVFGPHGRNGYCGVGYGPLSGVPEGDEVTVLFEACQLSHLKFCDLNPLEPIEAKLSDREAETLRWVARGLSNGKIAREMGISPSTVDTNLKRIFKKLGVRDRVSAALRGIVVGVFD
ncbi:MAG: LuxR family transcriptional regulator [Pseudomonadota bacterium]